MEAQKVHRIGALVAADQFVPAIEGFKKGMAELGYSEGKNVQYDFHNAKGDRETTSATLPVAKATEGTRPPVVFSAPAILWNLLRAMPAREII
ncbi:MAG TPA: ABC transporter substrate binding protein [Candidatus Binatia bacterium]|nr:ABC transporter substrate binding protein [Candidatus Binatia bacterium]